MGLLVKIDVDFEIENFDIVKQTTGQIIRGELFKLTDQPHGRCILVPPFGMSSLDLTSSAYYLIRNGFEVVKFDLCSHVGDSDGEMEDFTLSSMAEDVDLVLDKYATPSTSVICYSLSSRSAYRVLHKHNLFSAIFMSPVVNAHETIAHAAEEDAIGAQINGNAKPMYTVIGFDVKQEFCRDCVDSGFDALDGAIADARQIKFPTRFIIGNEDAWVERHEVAELVGQLSDARLISIPGGNHQLFRSPVMFQAFHKVMLGELSSLYGKNKAFQLPNLKDVVRFVSRTTQLRSTQRTREEVLL